MVRNTSTIRDANGWSWKFKNNKTDTTIPIGNPFQKEVEKIATSFYVTNFPDYVDAKRLWKEFESYGRIVDTFIANKRSKIGKRFGFVRFVGVKNKEELTSSLATIWIGSYHLFVAVAHFKRKDTKTGSPKSVENTSSNVPIQKVERQEMKKKHVILSDQELVQVDDTLEVALVKVKNVETMSSLYRLCREEGFDEIKIHHIGGLWLWLHFQNVETCNTFKNNNNLKSFFSLIKPVSKNFYVDERMVWVEISGLPLCAWGSNAFKKVASSVGRFMFFENDNSEAMSLGRVCVATRQKSFISEGVQVTVHGVDYDVQVKELGSWSINIKDSVSQDSESESQEGDEIDKGEGSESEGDIDEYQEENKQSNKEEEKETMEHQDESIHSNTSNEKETPIVVTESNKKSVTSDWSRPPGFKHFKDTAKKPTDTCLQSKLWCLISVWDPNYFVKDQIWCDDWYIIVQGKWVNSDDVFFMINIYGPQESIDKIAMWNRLLEFKSNHDGHYVIFGDLNEVRDESERYGTEFSRPAANVFKSFINDAGIFELALGGRNFTWMNKAGTEMSKLGLFLISHQVIDVFMDVKVTALPRGWSDHTPIMLHCDKMDYGPVPFKIFHSWFQRDGFDECIKKAYVFATDTIP
ncbi:RNA-directed DNA polymerase, eukaryota, reverse transcriptase zinc-binding domain protein [Tanacetum coccineum]